MPFVKIPGPDGTTITAHVRMSKRPVAKCAICRIHPHEFLCDFVYDDKTPCDRKLCKHCTTKDGDRDLCPFHTAPSTPIPTAA